MRTLTRPIPVWYRPEEGAYGGKERLTREAQGPSKMYSMWRKYFAFGVQIEEYQYFPENYSARK